MPEAVDARLEASATMAGEVGATSSASALVRGAELGRYVVLARLGEGGMGVVYAAYDPELDRKVALKLLHRAVDPSVGTSEGRSRLMREAQAMAKLSHPNVVAIHDVGTFEDRVFVALEFVDGDTLAAWRRERARSWREVLDVMLRAGRGLAAAHGAGLLHRDFKPDNVMIDRDGRVRVMDFGLARPAGAVVPVIDDTRANPELRALALEVTRQGAIVGTPAYMAPEQLAGQPTDARTDVFAFGVSAWEMLYGQRPFVGDALPELVANVLAGRVTAPPRDHRVPAWVRRVIARSFAVEPADRWQTMESLLQALARDPTRKRVRMAGVAVLALVPSVALGWSAYVGRRDERACVAAGAAIRDVWNDDVRQAMRDGMTASQLPFAETTWTKATP
jgi:eukaryotic-like serine/threonine-protein kinase